MAKFKITRTDDTFIEIEADYIYAEQNGQLDVVKKITNPSGFSDRAHVAVFASGHWVEAVEVQDGS